MTRLNVIEPAICPDTVVTGALELDKVGGNVRLVLYSSQRSLHDGSLEHLVCSKLFGSRRDLLKIALGIVRELTDNAPAETISATLDCLEEGSRH
ncbi:hypothetical protein SAMN04488498_113124 [Mesorhizobium albiziae]|uniref:Uncharacterized protein n=1 Tax=Neomesorhizobium albiziae TaxID=335020 RepID=A0A1I4CKW3_9HYPH|nr:hypothetical protein [Mesorhizobium albiziae]GLS29320.1 hypothetical protein GCM10007937_10280 [Mesorhizobium albiziae]SFK81555.1 hypothetical protein SAMN04488498_113124 [Mesorhizobium albiziae]